MRKNNKTMLFILFILIVLICVYYGQKKSGMFIDEIYSYGLSNSHYNPFVKSIKDDNMIDKVYTSQEFYDYISNKDERLDFTSVYYNQTQDVHPPLYYWLLNISSAIWGGGFTKWSGISLNIIIYIATLIVLYQLCKKLFHRDGIALLCVVLYGFSSIGLSTMLMIRMYVLLTLLSVMLAYLIALYLEKRKKWLGIVIGINIFLGLMTQYYFVFYAFFLCLMVDVYLFVKKEYKSMFGFSVSALLGVAGMVLVYPSCIEHLTADKLVSGKTAVENLISFSAQIGKVINITIDVIYNMKLPVLIGVIAVVFAVFKSKKVLLLIKEKQLDAKAIIIIIPAFLTLVTIAVISPMYSLRYIYNIVPIFVILIALMLYVCASIYNNETTICLAQIISLVLVVFLSVAMLSKKGPDYVYEEHSEYNHLVQEYSDYPCIYMNDNYNAPMTQDLLQLMYFNDVLVTNDVESEAIIKYLDTYQNTDKCVVYIDTSEYWSSGYEPKDVLSGLIENYDYTRYELLYKFGLSETYVLTKE